MSNNNNHNNNNSLSQKMNTSSSEASSLSSSASGGSGISKPGTSPEPVVTPQGHIPAGTPHTTTLPPFSLPPYFPNQKESSVNNANFQGKLKLIS